MTSLPAITMLFSILANCEEPVAQARFCLGSQFNWNFPTAFHERLRARYAAGCISLSSFSRAAFAHPCQRGSFGVTLPR